MKPEAVNAMLRDYKRCQARRDFLQAELPLAERQLRYEREHMLENEALRGRRPDETGHGSENADPTARLVLKFASGYEPRYIKDMAWDIQKRRDEMQECDAVCRCVEAWLQALGEKERMVVQTHVLEGLSWTEAGPRLSAVFPDTCPTTHAGLRRIQQKALEKIYRAAW